jgi:ribosomal protein S18 acetylase RimI-like enzyme
MEISKAEKEDLPQILSLQYLAYQSEAELFKSKDIPPLKQTLNELEEEFDRGLILKLTSDDNKIIGSVRANSDGKTTYIGKLMVHPDYRHQGFGRKLLIEIERCFPNTRYELFTSTKSLDNIRFYKSMGYEIFNQKEMSEELIFTYMQK